MLEEKQITSTSKEIMKRRPALGRKDKSNSIIIIFSWASLSDEKHAVSLDLVP